MFAGPKTVSQGRAIRAFELGDDGIPVIFLCLSLILARNLRAELLIFEKGYYFLSDLAWILWFSQETIGLLVVGVGSCVLAQALELASADAVYAIDAFPRQMWASRGKPYRNPILL